MKRRRLAAAGTILIGLALFGATWSFLFPRKRVELRWKLQPGQVLRYRTVMATSSTAGTSEQSWVDVVRVLAVDADGAITFTHVTESMTARKSGTGSLDYSSARGDPLPKDPEILGAACLVGMPLEVRMNPRGELLDIQGVEEKERRRIQAVDKMNFMGWLTMVPLRSNPLWNVELPARPLAVRDHWSQDSVFGSDTVGRTHSRATYTLLKIQPDAVDLGMTSEVLGRTPQSEHRQDHRIRFSPKRGLLLSERDFSRIDSTLTNGKPFFFEATTETTLVEK